MKMLLTSAMWMTVVGSVVRCGIEHSGNVRSVTLGGNRGTKTGREGRRREAQFKTEKNHAAKVGEEKVPFAASAGAGADVVGHFIEVTLHPFAEPTVELLVTCTISQQGWAMKLLEG